MLNETLTHAESGAFRAVTGSAYNIPDAYGNILYGSNFPKVGTIPNAVTREGTFVTTGKAVRGTNTKFTKLTPGSYLYNGTAVREIDYIVSDTLMFLRQAFQSDVGSATAVKVCERQIFKMIYAKSTHASDSALVQEAPYRPGDVFVNGGAPVAYDATSGEISFSLHR